MGLFSLALTFVLVQTLHAQRVFAPLNTDYYHLLDRLEIKQDSFSNTFYTSTKPYGRKAIAAFLERVDATTLSRQDKFNHAYLLVDNWMFTSADQAYQAKKPFLKKLYRAKSSMFHVRKKGLDLQINPILNGRIGSDKNVANRPYQLNRGFAIQGTIDGKIGFYSYLTESLLRPTQYVQDYINRENSIPGQGFLKLNQGLYDTFTARGYITFDLTKSIHLQFGHDKNFVGNGMRSVILSDFSDEYLFLKIQTKVWKIQYTNIFAQLIADNTKFGNIFPKKYMAFHHLSINLAKNLNIGVFEAITFSRQDSLGHNYFDWEYLNPIIFYRALEQDAGDPDNVLLGMDMKWHLWNRVQMYGQFVFDEFKYDDFVAGNGWWANKYAYQIGIKYIDMLGIDNLDLQIAYNGARPYTYTHGGGNADFSNYGHFKQPLAHPLGANFKEIQAMVRYQPTDRLRLKLYALMYQKGEDENGNNYGGNIFLDYNSRLDDFNNTTLQGNLNEVVFINTTASYQLKHNLLLDLQYIYRKQKAANNNDNYTTNYVGVALRLNFPDEIFRF